MYTFLDILSVINNGFDINFVRWALVFTFERSL